MKKKKTSLDKLEEAHGRVLQLQKVKGAHDTDGGVSLIGNRISNSCSTRSSACDELIEECQKQKDEDSDRMRRIIS